MNPTEKALWFVESHLPETISLDMSRKAAACRASRDAPLVPPPAVRDGLHARAPAERGGAQTASGAPDILSVALDAGYNSHEAFTRAFRDQFATTPELVCAKAASTISISWSRSRWTSPCLPASSRRASRPAALPHRRPRRTLQLRSSAAIPMQWQRFGPYRQHSGRDRRRCLWRLRQRRRCRQFRLHRRCRGFGLFRPSQGIQPRSRARAEIRGVRPSGSHLHHPPHRQHDLEQMAAGLRARHSRRPRIRTLRTGVRSAQRQWRAGDLDPGEGLKAATAPGSSSGQPDPCRRRDAALRRPA